MEAVDPVGHVCDLLFERRSPLIYVDRVGKYAQRELLRV